MRALIELARDLLWLRRGPQDLPYSPRLSTLLFLVACAADLVSALIVPDGDDVLLKVVVGNALMVGLPWVALNIAGLNARFAQVAGAMSLVSIAFAVLVFPLLVLNMLDPSPRESATRVLAALIYLVLLGWYIVVEGGILRHALKLPLALAIAIALIFELTNIQVRNAWFGEPTQQNVPADNDTPPKKPTT